MMKKVLTVSLFLFCLLPCVYAGGGGWSVRTPPADLTKPNGLPLQDNPWLFTVGPTGLIGIYVGGPKFGELRGQQIFVRKVDKGSPADGKFKVGDVILGVNGKRFTETKGHLILTLGNAIDEAEKEENGGKITFIVWRDANYRKRDALININIRDLDINEFFKEVKADTSADLERYKTAAQVKKGIAESWKELYEKVPIDAKVIEIPLTLEVMGGYSETSPFDCPKITKIREQAYPHLEKTIQAKGLRGWSRCTIGLALLASGKPEHVEMVKTAVHKNKRWMSQADPDISNWGGAKAWFLGYELSFLGEYYHRTGDKKVFKGLAAVAAETARIQAGGGTWGHSRADRAKNFGKLHGPCPGYGAMNQAGGPCFYGLTLAQKAGIGVPLVDDAVRRAIRFNSMVVDKGCVGYGYHLGGSHADSNGKNGPPGLAMRMVGENYMAQYFALTCAVANTWGYRGGHGDGTFGNYWPQLTSCLAGKDVVIEWMKKARPYYTMARRWDGTFVSVERGNALGIGCLFDPTAMYMLHFSIPMAKLYMTGRDPVPEIQASAKDLQDLKDRINGINPADMQTQTILNKLDTFALQKRMQYAEELASRIRRGEDGTEAKVAAMMNHKNPRGREGALMALRYAGKETVGRNLEAVLGRLDDSTEIVRRAAVKAIAVFSVVEEDVKRKKGKDHWIPPGKVDMSPFIKPFFKASLKTYPDDTVDNANTHCLLMKVLIDTDNPFARDPFGQGYDEKEVRRVLESFCAMDPREGVMKGPGKYWDRATCVKMAGPIIFVAGVRQTNNRMGGGGSIGGGQRLLLKYKFVEGIEAGIEDCYKIARTPRAIRQRLLPNTSWFAVPTLLSYKGIGKRALPWMRSILVDRMNLREMYKVGKTDRRYVPLYKAIDLIDNHDTPEGWSSLGDAAMEAYLQEADAAGGRDAQIQFCRATLEPERLTWFRQMAAMDRLVALLGTEAIPDLAPYLNHDQWRLYDHARALVMKMDGAAPQLVKLAGSKDESVVAAALELLGTRGDKEGLTVGLQHIETHESGRVRGAAAQAAYGGSAGAALEKVLSAMKGADDPEELEGCEKALLLKRGDEARDKALSAAARTMIPDSSLPVRRSLYYVLGQVGGEENLAFLKGAVGTEDNGEFQDIVAAVSWSPDIAATRVCLDILKAHEGTSRALEISKIIEKRMVNGATVVGKVPDEVNLDFAEEHLKVVRNIEVLKFLGRIHRGRSVALLLNYMKLGPAKVTSTAAEGIGPAASGLSEDLPLEERKAAAEALGQVLEYARQTVLRFGPLGEGSGIHRFDVVYGKWKKISDDVGKVLKRIYSPVEEGVTPLGEDEEDLDI